MALCRSTCMRSSQQPSWAYLVNDCQIQNISNPLQLVSKMFCYFEADLLEFFRWMDTTFPARPRVSAPQPVILMLSQS